MIAFTYTGNGEYIMGIPARDLTQYDLENIAHLRGEAIDDVIALVTSRGLYKPADHYVCKECGKEYKSHAAYHKHVLSHVEPEPIEEADNGIRS